MFIEKVEIQNFRCIRQAEIELDDLTCIVGRNGVGKSTLLYALESFYNVGASYSQFDYFNHQLNDAEIRIRVTYAGLRAEERVAFGSYIHDDKLIVIKKINQGGARYYGVSAQIELFAELRRLAATERRNQLKAHVDAGNLPEFPAIPRRNEEVDAAMTLYESQHPEMTALIERETQFLGPRNVGGGTLDKFTRFVLVPAVRDASNELEKRGAIMQLLDLIVTRSIASRQDFQDFKQQFEERARQLYGRENLPELADLGRLITERLARYAPGAALTIDFGDLKAPSIPLPEAVVSVSEDDFKVPVRYSGHGLQRALILALLEQLSMTTVSMREAQAADDQAALQPMVEERRFPDLILAVEEPELYLHPARSRYLANIFRRLAQRTEGQQAPLTQVALVTHSPYFVDVAHFNQVRMCRKRLMVEGEPPASIYSGYSLDSAARRLAEISGRRREEFTADSFVARSVPVLNSIVNEGLFADSVIVVEGESDAAALWAMQLSMNERWEERGIVVVPAGGKNNIDRAVVVFQGFGIPTYFLFDGDRAKREGAATNRRLLTLANENAVDFPDDFVGRGGAAFSEDLEAYLQTAVGVDYTAIRDECARQCGMDRLAESLKSSSVMSRFIRSAMAGGVEFDVLRRVVESVSAMVPMPAPVHQ
jgi:energy-coupling factor transporter ATP-binding protein EcfA2